MRHIGVALKHIDRGVRRNSNSCPVSLAIKEVFRASYVNVAMSGIRVEDELYATPQKVADWMSALRHIRTRPSEAIDIHPGGFVMRHIFHRTTHSDGKTSRTFFQCAKCGHESTGTHPPKDGCKLLRNGQTLEEFRASGYRGKAS